VETSGLVERSGRGPEPALVTRADAPGAVAAATMATHRTMRMMRMVQEMNFEVCAVLPVARAGSQGCGVW
jgi:hypothetical protein